jgi:hypothetical protein
MKTTRLSIIDPVLGAIAYVSASTKAEAWEQLKSKLMFMRAARDISNLTVRETVESTRRVDGTSFRFNDPCNPNNYRANSKSYKVWLEDSGKCDFVMVLKKKEI